MTSMTSSELFKHKKFKLVEAALRRIDCNTLCFIPRDFTACPPLDLSAYNVFLPFDKREPKHLVFKEDGRYYSIGPSKLGIQLARLVHDPRIDGNIDPFDYIKIFDCLFAMNIWIGTSTGETLLHGDGTDIYQLEIEADLQD